MPIWCTVAGTGEVVWIVGFAPNALGVATAIVLHTNGSLTAVALSTLTVDCSQYGCPVQP